MSFSEQLKQIEVESFNFVDAGNTKENFFLKGLSYKISIKTINSVSKVFMYSSDIFGNKTNKFDFENKGNGVFEYEEIAGQNATSEDIFEDENTNFIDIAKFFFKIIIQSDTSEIEIDRVFFVGETTDLVRFGNDLLQYIFPFPVLVDDFEIPLDFLINNKNGSGVRKYGGIKTVEVFKTPNVPSSDDPASGQMVTDVEETNIEELNSITIPDRTNENKLFGFITADGIPDYSNFFHFITFRFRSRKGSENYYDFDVVIFPSRKCKDSKGIYGYDSTGQILPAPEKINYCLVQGNRSTLFPPSFPASSDIITYYEAINIYSRNTNITVYDNDGNIIATGIGQPIDNNRVRVYRKDITNLFNSNSQNNIVSGFFKIKQLGFDSESQNTVESSIPNDLQRSVFVENILFSDNKNLVSIYNSQNFEQNKTYKIKEFDTQFNIENVEEINANFINQSTIEYENTGKNIGYIQIIENNIEILSPRYDYNVLIVPELPSLEDNTLKFTSFDFTFTGRSFKLGNDYYNFYPLDTGSSSLSTDINAKYRMFIYADSLYSNLLFVTNFDGIQHTDSFFGAGIGIPLPSFISMHRPQKYYINSQNKFEFFKSGVGGQLDQTDIVYPIIAEYSSITGNRYTKSFGSIFAPNFYQNFVSFVNFTEISTDSNGNTVIKPFQNPFFPASLNSGNQSILNLRIQDYQTIAGIIKPVETFLVHSKSEEFDNFGGALILKPDKNINDDVNITINAIDPFTNEFYQYTSFNTVNPSEIQEPII